MSDHESVHNVLSLLIRYLKGLDYTMERLMSITGTSDRTIRNYHKILKGYGFNVIYSHSTRTYKLDDYEAVNTQKLIEKLGLIQEEKIKTSIGNNLIGTSTINKSFFDSTANTFSLLSKLYKEDNSWNINTYLSFEYLDLKYIINKFDSLQ